MGIKEEMLVSYSVGNYINISEAREVHEEKDIDVEHRVDKKQCAEA